MKQHGNRAVKKKTLWWYMNEEEKRKNYKLREKKHSYHTYTAKWHDLEAEVKWMTNYTQNKISVSTKITIFERRRRMVTESITDSAETTWCHRIMKRHGLENERLLRSYIMICEISNALDGTDDVVMKSLWDSEWQKLHNGLQFCCSSTVKVL